MATCKCIKTKIVKNEYSLILDEDESLALADLLAYVSSDGHGQKTRQEYLNNILRALYNIGVPSNSCDDISGIVVFHNKPQNRGAKYGGK